MKYFYSLLASLIIALMTTGYICFKVDPYGIYQPTSAQSLSRINQFNFMRSTKALQLPEKLSDVIIIGSSISGRLHTDHPVLERYRPYNLSIPGATPFELFQLLQYANNIHPLKEVIIGLDFEAI